MNERSYINMNARSHTVLETCPRLFYYTPQTPRISLRTMALAFFLADSMDL